MCGIADFLRDIVYLSNLILIAEDLWREDIISGFLELKFVTEFLAS